MTPAVTCNADAADMGEVLAASDRPGSVLVASTGPSQTASRTEAFPLDQYLEFRRLLAESDLNGAIGE